MKYIRTKDVIYSLENATICKYKNKEYVCPIRKEETFEEHRCREHQFISPKWEVINQANTIEELCDCFVKIKRKGNCKPYILKFDYRDLPTLKEQAIKYKDSPVYGAIHIEDKGLIYVAKMNEKGCLELL